MIKTQYQIFQLDKKQIKSLKRDDYKEGMVLVNAVDGYEDFESEEEAFHWILEKKDEHAEYLILPVYSYMKVKGHGP